MPYLLSFSFATVGLGWIGMRESILDACAWWMVISDAGFGCCLRGTEPGRGDFRGAEEEVKFQGDG